MIIGLTGGIAMGKSNVSSYLAELGAPVIDADQITHQLQQPGQPGYNAIVSAFGNDLLGADGNLNRRALGQLVFSDSRQMKRLVRIMDPSIRQTIYQRLKQFTDNEVVILDAPTLFENGYTYLVDQIMLVHCSVSNQLERLMERDGLNADSAKQRIQSQWPINIKKRLSDVLIDSNGTISQTRGQVLKWWNNTLD